MAVQQFTNVAAFAAVAGLAASVASATIPIPTVPVGNPGNAPDPTTGNLYGSVAYNYNIGQTEVTNAQYAAFLNAVAKTDTNNLYNTNMAGSFGGITRSGGPGTYSYSTISGRANNPVNFVSFWDATRFANWLHNGQPMGAQDNSTTEDGAYTLTPDGITNNTITRNTGWQWAVTSEDEWYKAAYHQPASVGGDGDNYWSHSTSTNGMSSDMANYSDSGWGNTLPVGSYGANFYGTYDMGGNVWEWNEASAGVNRVLRGGSFYNGAIDQGSTASYDGPPTVEGEDLGFRVVAIPTPASAALLALAGLVAARRRRV